MQGSVQVDKNQVVTDWLTETSGMARAFANGDNIGAVKISQLALRCEWAEIRPASGQEGIHPNALHMGWGDRTLAYTQPPSEVAGAYFFVAVKPKEPADKPKEPAESKAVRRIQALEDQVEWKTVVHESEEIDGNALREKLRTRGYTKLKTFLELIEEYDAKAEAMREADARLQQVLAEVDRYCQESETFRRKMRQGLEPFNEKINALINKIDTFLERLNQQ